MADEETSTSGIFNFFKNGVTAVPEMVFSNMFGRLADGADALIDRVENRVDVIQESVIKSVMYSAAIGVSVLFFLLAFLFFMIEYLETSRTFAFFVVGLIVLVVGLIIKPKK